jgi:hypothetical protein
MVRNSSRMRSRAAASAAPSGVAASSLRRGFALIETATSVPGANGTPPTRGQETDAKRYMERQ